MLNLETMMALVWRERRLVVCWTRAQTSKEGPSSRIACKLDAGSHASGGVNLMAHTSDAFLAGGYKQSIIRASLKQSSLATAFLFLVLRCSLYVSRLFS